MSYQKFMALGNVGQVGELKEFQNGGAALQASLAVTRKGYKTKDGREIKEQTDWFNLAFYNSLAKVAHKYVKKGDKLFIEGELKNRSYKNKNGETAYITEVMVTKLELLTPKKDSQQSHHIDPQDSYTADVEGDLPF